MTTTRSTRPVRAASDVSDAAEAPAAGTDATRLIGVGLSRLMRAAARARAHDAASGGPFHMMALLWALRDQGPLRANALADAVHSDPSTVSRQVASLVDQGLVRREADPDDRRAAQLAITDEGQAVVAEKLRHRDDYLASITASWSDRDRLRFGELLDRFSTDFAAHLTDATLTRTHTGTMTSTDTESS